MILHACGPTSGFKNSYNRKKKMIMHNIGFFYSLWRRKKMILQIYSHSHMRRKEMRLHPWGITTGLFTYVGKKKGW